MRCLATEMLMVVGAAVVLMYDSVAAAASARVDGFFVATDRQLRRKEAQK